MAVPEKPIEAKISEIEFRKLNSTEIGQAAELKAREQMRDWGESYSHSLDHFAGVFKQAQILQEAGKAIILGAFHRNRLVGVAYAMPFVEVRQYIPDPVVTHLEEQKIHLGRTIYFGGTATDSEFQRIGIAGKLTELRMEFARNQKFIHAFSYTSPDVADGKQFQRFHKENWNIVPGNYHYSTLGLRKVFFWKHVNELSKKNHLPKEV